MVEHKTNVSETYLPVSVITAETSNLIKEKVSLRNTSS